VSKRRAAASDAGHAAQYAALCRMNAAAVEGQGGDPNYFRRREFGARAATLRARPEAGPRSPRPRVRGRAAAGRPRQRRRAASGATRAGPDDPGDPDPADGPPPGRRGVTCEEAPT
jgi:hypothetical protein